MSSKQRTKKKKPRRKPVVRERGDVVTGSAPAYVLNPPFTDQQLDGLIDMVRQGIVNKDGSVGSSGTYAVIEEADGEVRVLRDWLIHSLANPKTDAQLRYKLQLLFEALNNQ